MKRWEILTLILTVALAVGMRAFQLDRRPLHNDEAVNAIKLNELWQEGRYRYDPDEYHGPALHYTTLPFLWLSGARHSDDLSDGRLRIAPIAFGVGLILLMGLFADGVGRRAILWTSLFIALSPAMVFYSRYFIHEMLLVFATALMLGAGWRYLQKPGAGWAAGVGSGLGLMITTKETFVISLAAMVGAGGIMLWWTRRALPPLKDLTRRWNPRHVAVAAGTALLLWLLLFSSFFTHFPGLKDSVLTYLPWLHRAGGHSPHLHPWTFYLELLAWFHPVKGPVWSEGFILALAAVGVWSGLSSPRTGLHRFLALYTLLLTAAYSAIAYKTPWCLLNFYWGMLLLAGVGAARLVECCRTRSTQTLTTVVFLTLTAQLGWQAWQAAVPFATDRRNPYVYAHTTPDVMTLVQRAEGIAGVAPAGHETVIKVIAPESDYWPLPWYLRRFKHLGWYDQIPQDPFAPMVMVSSKFDARLDEKSDKKWIMAGISELRPGKFFELYVELELWKKYVETLPRDRE